MKTTLAIALLLATTGVGAATSGRLTESCNTRLTNWVSVYAGPDMRQAIVAAVVDPGRDPDLYERLWRPTLAADSPFSSTVTLTFERAQDIIQIASEISADSVLRARGVQSAADGGFGCFAAMPAPPSVTLVEYRNRILDHYFISSSDAENRSIEAGQAGAGWERTGETQVATLPDACYSRMPVYRFYGEPGVGPNSHFYTADPHECGVLRKAGTGWLLEGIAFGAALVQNGACPNGTQPVWRLYNQRWMFNDSNHRYVTRLSSASQMLLQGWALEGIAFCL